jgi:hypothetical protein
MTWILLKRKDIGAVAVIRAQRWGGSALQDCGGRISSPVASCGESADLQSTAEADGGMSEAGAGRCITGVTVAQPQQTQSQPPGQQLRSSDSSSSLSSLGYSSPGQHESAGFGPPSHRSAAGPGAVSQSWPAAGTVGTTNPRATTSKSRRRRNVSTAFNTNRFSAANPARLRACRKKSGPEAARDLKTGHEGPEARRLPPGEAVFGRPRSDRPFVPSRPRLPGLPGRIDHQPRGGLWRSHDRAGALKASLDDLGKRGSKSYGWINRGPPMAIKERIGAMRASFSWKLLALIGVASFVSSGRPVMAQETDDTTIDDIVMYAVESSCPARLMRYFFLSDIFVPIGEVWTKEGLPVDDVEALSWVPQGPYKGLYGVATDGPTEQYLTRIDPLTAEATVFGSNIGGSNITGMIAEYDASLGEWWLLASDKGGKLRRINVANGNAETICNIGHDFEGLARNSEGVLYGNTKTRLYRIDPDLGNQYVAVEIGSTGLDKAESLEFAFGNSAPPIDIPGVNKNWTTNGVLFVFDDDTNMFGVLNPNTGQFKQYLVDGMPSSFSNQDAEGMIFVTTLTDPLYGSIDGFD